MVQTKGLLHWDSRRACHIQRSPHLPGHHHQSQQGFTQVRRNGVAGPGLHCPEVQRYGGCGMEGRCPVHLYAKSLITDVSEG